MSMQGMEDSPVSKKRATWETILDGKVWGAGILSCKSEWIVFNPRASTRSHYQHSP